MKPPAGGGGVGTTGVAWRGGDWVGDSVGEGVPVGVAVDRTGVEAVPATVATDVGEGVFVGVLANDGTGTTLVGVAPGRGVAVAEGVGTGVLG